MNRIYCVGIIGCGRMASTIDEDGRAALELALAFHVSHRKGGEKVYLPLEDTSLTVTNPKYYGS